MAHARINFTTSTIASKLTSQTRQRLVHPVLRLGESESCVEQLAQAFSDS